mmetsp:Transcript_56573/g.128259  ORF Transcript_56573/g.128259 Transcript_56573/m.128259 type:complete len:256 (-) Transcript_56573:1083-1850(-)
MPSLNMTKGAQSRFGWSSTGLMVTYRLSFVALWKFDSELRALHLQPNLGSRKQRGKGKKIASETQDAHQQSRPTRPKASASSSTSLAGARVRRSLIRAEAKRTAFGFDAIANRTTPRDSNELHWSNSSASPLILTASIMDKRSRLRSSDAHLKALTSNSATLSMKSRSSLSDSEAKSSALESYTRASRTSSASALRPGDARRSKFRTDCPPAYLRPPRLAFKVLIRGPNHLITSSINRRSLVSSIDAKPSTPPVG